MKTTTSRLIKQSIFQKYEGQWVALIDGIEEPVAGGKDLKDVIREAEDQYSNEKISYMPVLKFDRSYAFSI